MPTKAYTVLGWAIWQVARVLAKCKMGKNRVKLGAAATVLGILVAGVAVARAAASSEES